MPYIHTHRRAEPHDFCPSDAFNLSYTAPSHSQTLLSVSTDRGLARELDHSSGALKEVPKHPGEDGIL